MLREKCLVVVVSKHDFVPSSGIAKSVTCLLRLKTVYLQKQKINTSELTKQKHMRLNKIVRK